VNRLPWSSEFAKAVPDAKWGEPMSAHTTFAIGGPADCFVEAKDIETLKRVFELARKHRLPIFHLGFGSNLLVRDGGIRGIVLKLGGEFNKLEKLEGRRVRAGAAVRLPRFVMFCAEHDLAGSEPLVGVPGTVGGALVMNAGTREGEIGPLARVVEWFDPERLEAVSKPASEVKFAYRHSDLEGRLVIGAELELSVGDKRDIMRRVEALQRRRAQTQPIHTFNVGSVFKNPPGRFVAQLIEESGLKGAAEGGARISPLHANFIENHDEAKASNVLALVERARAAVRERFGLELELEMKVVGEPA
jgi:UDP-N-acetylmuramate dehydrogenase